MCMFSGMQMCVSVCMFSGQVRIISGRQVCMTSGMQMCTFSGRQVCSRVHSSGYEGVYVLG